MRKEKDLAFLKSRCIQNRMIFRHLPGASQSFLWESCSSCGSKKKTLSTVLSRRWPSMELPSRFQTPLSFFTFLSGCLKALGPISRLLPPEARSSEEKGRVLWPSRRSNRREHATGSATC